MKFRFLGNTRLPHRKDTAHMPAVIMEAPKEVLLPTLQHIGNAATPIVKVGDEVKLGQKIAEANGKISSSVYASVSGKVTKIEDYLRSDGNVVPAIRIENDGLMEKHESITPPVINGMDDFVAAVRESGLVGLGGAGFPTDVKLEAIENGKVKYLVINAAECEPYITVDTRTMLDEGEYIAEGVELLRKYLPQLEKIVVGIERNKPKSIKKMTEILDGTGIAHVVPLPERYPQGAEKVLLYNTMGITVPEGKLPIDVGALVMNVSSIAFIAKYVRTGMPLVSRMITVDGSAIASPQNVIAPIGASIEDVINFCGGFKCEAGKILFGGPMMGIAVCSLQEPVIKTTNAIVALNLKDSEDAESTECIHCGKCVEACPLSLNPAGYSKALDIDLKEEKIAALEKYKVNICMECGCCSYVCPARRPLVENSRIAKMILRDHYEYLSTLNK